MSKPLPSRTEPPTQEFLVRLKAVPGWGGFNPLKPEYRLRGLLKKAWRQFGLRCVECKPIQPEAVK